MKQVFAVFLAVILGVGAASTTSANVNATKIAGFAARITGAPCQCNAPMHPCPPAGYKDGACCHGVGKNAPCETTNWTPQTCTGAYGSWCPARPGPPVWVAAVACNSTDPAQHGWAYNASSNVITRGGMCMQEMRTIPDPSDDGGWMVQMLSCDGSSAQYWSSAGNDAPIHPVEGWHCLDVFGFEGPIVQSLHVCNGGSNQDFTISGGAFKVGSGQCLTTTPNEPHQR